MEKLATCLILLITVGMCYAQTSMGTISVPPPKFSQDPPTKYSGLKSDVRKYVCKSYNDLSTGQIHQVKPRTKYFVVKNNVAYFCDEKGKRTGFKYHYKDKINDSYMFCYWSINDWYLDIYITVSPDLSHVSEFQGKRCYYYGRQSKTPNSASSTAVEKDNKKRSTASNKNTRGKFRYVEPTTSYAQPPLFTSSSPTTVSPPAKSKQTSTCPRCHGTGYYRWHAHVPNFNGETRYSTCRNCSQKFDIDTSHMCKCQMCNGIGER